MKLRYLLTLPILATALMGCDTVEWSDAKPVENPQLAEITQTDFSVTPSAALTQGINLDELSANTTDPASYMVQLYTINLLAELPAEAQVDGGIELSLSPDFNEVFYLENITTVDNVVSASLESLLYTRGTMISTVDPREYEIFYRIPIYVTLDGGQYKIGDKNFFYNNGDSFPESGVDPGYFVDDAYYLLGALGTDITTAVKFDDSGYNVYENSDFSLTVTFEQGCTTWQIVPQTQYLEAIETGTVNTANVYGPSDPTALTGSLELGAIGTLTDDTKYQISFNAQTLEYSIKEMPKIQYGEPTGVFLRGGMNDWGAPATYEFIGTDDPNVYIMPYITISEGTEFKVADADWALINLGGGAQTTIMPNVDFALDGGANITMGADFVGSAILTSTPSGEYTLLLQTFETATAGEASGIYVKGGMNGWSDNPDYEFLTTAEEGVYYLADQSIEAGTEFKVADANWGPINLGTTAGAGAFDETSGTGILGLMGGDNPANITLAQNFNGDLRLVMVNEHYYLYFLLNTPAE